MLNKFQAASSEVQFICNVLKKCQAADDAVGLYDAIRDAEAHGLQVSPSAREVCLKVLCEDAFKCSESDKIVTMLRQDSTGTTDDMPITLGMIEATRQKQVRLSLLVVVTSLPASIAPD